MTTTLTTTHHRFSDPLAIAAAVIVVIGGASVVGVALSADEPAAPTAPSQAQVVQNPPSRIGQGDFTHAQANSARPRSFRPGLGEFTQP